MRLLMAVLTLVLSTAFRTIQPQLNSSANWHFYPLTFHPEELFMLFELIRNVNDGSRSLLTADFETTPIVLLNATTGLWSISAEYWDVEVWAHHLSYGFVQVPKGSGSM